jgi:autotransporter-associated beta strand protein
MWKSFKTSARGNAMAAGFGVCSAFCATAFAEQLDLKGRNVSVDTLNLYSGVTNSGGAAAVLTIGGASSSSNFGGIIEDGASAVVLTKSGRGTLTLDAANNYSGGTNLNAGILTIANAQALGFGAISISDVATLGFTGVTSLSNGIVFTGLGGPTNVRGSASLDTGGSNVTLSGAVSGAGALTKIGAGTLTLTGANTYTGGTFVNAGALVAGNAGALGTRAVSLADGVRLGFAGPMTFTNSIAFAGAGGASLDTGASNVTLSGVVSGGGALTKIGAGTLTLAGLNTYTGGTALDAGTLEIANAQALGSGALSMADNTTLRFTGAANLSNKILLAGSADPIIDTGSAFVTLGGVIAGQGSLTKIGSGTLALAGADTYAGATLVSQGTLQVDGSIVSATTVAQGATLSGAGVVAGVDILPGGALAPGNAGNPFGALRSTGNVSFAPGSTYRVSLNPTATSLLSTSGSASVAGAVAATWTGGAPSEGARYTILTASNGVKGTFSSLTFQGLSTNLPVLAYDANDVYLVFSGPSTAAVRASLQTLAGDRQGAMVTNRVLASVLGGVNEQINCTNCVSGFGSVGSLSAGVHGRLTLNANLARISQTGTSNVEALAIFDKP